MASVQDEYRVSGKGKIRLKETPHDKAERVYRREQKRMRSEQNRINRANGYAVSPPRNGREESMSPPRNPPRQAAQPELEDEDDTRWMGGHGRAAKEQMDRFESMEQMAWLAQEEAFRGDPFGSMGFGSSSTLPDVHIPLRHRQAAGFGPGFADTFFSTNGVGPSSLRRDAAREVHFDGGAVPAMAHMGEEEYAEWVREGMYNLKNRSEVERQERVRREKLERERMAEEAKERARKDEKKRIEKLKRQKGREEEERRKRQRERYRTRWEQVGEVGGEIEETQLSFEDIPWPVYIPVKRSLDLDDLEPNAVQVFLEAIATDRGDELKKVLRDAIRAFHPDRFFSRILLRVAERDKEAVKEGVEKCSRIINALAADMKA